MKRRLLIALAGITILSIPPCFGTACNGSLGSVTECACTTSVWPSPTPDPARTDEALFRSLAIPADYEKCMSYPDTANNQRLILVGTVFSIIPIKDRIRIILIQEGTENKWVVSDIGTWSDYHISEGNVLEVLGEFRGINYTEASLDPAAGLPFIGTWFMTNKSVK